MNELLTESARFTSADGTVRYLLAMQDGKTVESVFIPETGRDTICISSQVGCPIDCKFCLTARLGLDRNLSAAEISGQVLHLMLRHKLDPVTRPLSIVLMGQGEPLMNLENVLEATAILTDQRGAALTERRISLSTSGLTPKIEELGRAKVRPRLAVSLNASHEEQRREIMPITNKWGLDGLLEACRSFPLRRREYLLFEYVLLAGVNDTDEDAGRLVGLLDGIECKVNLIALNPAPGIAYGRPTDERVAAFQRIVVAKIPCYVRKSRGVDIYAACGQLQALASEHFVTNPFQLN